MTTDSKLAVSIKDAAVAVGIGRSKIYELIKAGDLIPRKCGSRTLILLEDLKHFIESLPTAQTEGGGDVQT